MSVQLALQDWEGAIDTANKCLDIDSNCIPGTQVMALEQCVIQGKPKEVAKTLGQLIQQLDRSEPKSHHIYYALSQAFARLSGGNPQILQQTGTLLERALALQPFSAEYNIEKGYQAMIGGNVEEALGLYKNVFSLDEGSIEALGGMILCLLRLGRYREAEHQLEFLNEIQKASAKTAEVLYLNAISDQHKGADGDHILSLLNEAVKKHFSTVKGHALSLRYYTLLNPEFLIRIASIMMAYAPPEPPSVGRGQSSSDVLQSITAVLDPLTLTAPGLLHAQLMLAKIKYLAGDSEGAISLSDKCIDSDHGNVEPHLLQSLIHLHNDNHTHCLQCLDTALSKNFEVQQYPLYHIIKGKQEYGRGLVSDSIKSLETALSLAKSPPRGKTTPLLSSPSKSEWVGVYLTLAQAHSKLNHTPEAVKIMQDAINRFAGTPEEARVTIANAELLLHQGNAHEAIVMLQKVTEDKPYYIQARERMADIYLTHHKNKAQYIQCYQDLYDKLPGPPTALLLGDAFMNVQEPEQALKIYEKELKKTPQDSVLASKVGGAYIRTHNYNKAINYYEASLKAKSHSGLRCDLATLYMKIKHYEKAERTLLTGIDHLQETEETLQSLREMVGYQSILGQVYQRARQSDVAIDTHMKCRDLQVKVVKMAAMEDSGLVEQEKEKLANILCDLVDCIKTSSEDSPGIETYYKQALDVCKNHTKAHVSLVEWYLLVGRIDQCEQECVTLIQNDPSNESAAMIMAELLVAKGNIETAIGRFEDLLSQKQTNYVALSHLIDSKRRLGKLEESLTFIEAAESCANQFVHEPGLNYCKGLYNMYLGESEAALKCFNQARRDMEWGERAIFAMVYICLNPIETLGSEVLKGAESDSKNVERLEAEIMATKTAEKLLKEVHPNTPAGQLQAKVLQNYALLVTKSKANAEKALSNFQAMTSNEKDKIPSVLGMAMAYNILKQVPRARNQLKRLGKTPWSARYCKELEHGWLLLGDMYIQSGKYDLATEQLKKCITYNKSCSKAWEYLGYISEKDQAYQDAADRYSNAWKYSHMANPAVGYRLAFNYLKSQKYVEAVEVSHHVLLKHPSYPSIRRDILDKARQSIRM